MTPDYIQSLIFHEVQKANYMQCCIVWIVWANNSFYANKKCCQNKEHKYSLVVMGSCFSKNVQIKFLENDTKQHKASK